MDTQEAFAPRPLATYTITATASSAAIALPVDAGGQVRVVAGASDVRIEFGKTAAVAVVKPAAGAPGSLTVKAGFTETFTTLPGTAYVAAATDTGTSVVEFTPGIGL